MNIRQAEGKITALYERLSKDDGFTDSDSNSIVNQKRMLEDFAASKGFTNCIHYTDDGWSGGTFERPSWKRLLEDIEAGKVGIVLAKDMSRIGRDYLQTGFYTEVLFREKDVRFIAISNGVDSADSATSEFAPFLNIMNEWYLKDCSRKQKSAYQARSKAGKPVTNHAIYGYLKDPEDKHHWIIDEEAAQVVRRMFTLCIMGNGPQQIANILRDDKVERPAVYLARKGLGTCKTQVDMTRPYDWCSTSVSTMLSKPEYLGHTVNFRAHAKSYKGKKMVPNPPEEWVIIENTHEAIIDQGTWDTVQKIRKTPKRTDSNGIANPLTGLMYCADCGAKMYNHKGTTQGKLDPATGLRTNDSYNCSAYRVSVNYSEPRCFSHYINTHAVRALVLETIQRVSKYAITNQEEFIEKVRAASTIQQMESAKELERQIRKAEKRHKELDTLIQKLYESYALEKITESRFDMLCGQYEAEQASLGTTIAEWQAQLKTYEDDTEHLEEFLALARKYTDFSELTTPMINEFVDKIMVHAPVKVDGERTQEVEIYLKYVGKVDLPADLFSELTPEEQKVQERKRRERAYYREYYQRKKAEREAEETALAIENVTA